MPETDETEASNPEVVEIKNPSVSAVKVLEEGKQVAILNLLKRIVSN
jgi:hypothetical protein